MATQPWPSRGPQSKEKSYRTFAISGSPKQNGCITLTVSGFPKEESEWLHNQPS